MKLEQNLARDLIRLHPERAALALEQLDVAQATRIVSRISKRDAASVLERMSTPMAAAVLDALDVEKTIEIVEMLPLSIAARLLRRISSEQSEGVFGQLSSRRVRALRTMMRFPEGTAGALMDPDVVALRESLTAREALDMIRKTPQGVRYNLYVVDPQQCLVGVVNLRELMLADPDTRLADFMVRDPQRLDARADSASVVSHPGWREAHSLPVVEEQGSYLGALRYKTLRALEDALSSNQAADADPRESLRELFSAGAGAVFDAVLTPASNTRGQ